MEHVRGEVDTLETLIAALFADPDNAEDLLLEYWQLAWDQGHETGYDEGYQEGLYEQ